MINYFSLFKRLYAFLISIFPRGASSRTFQLLLAFILQQQQRLPVSASQTVVDSFREGRAAIAAAISTTIADPGSTDSSHSSTDEKNWSCVWPPVVSQQLSTELMRLSCCDTPIELSERRDRRKAAAKAVQAIEAAAFADAVLRTQSGSVALALAHLMPSIVPDAASVNKAADGGVSTTNHDPKLTKNQKHLHEERRHSVAGNNDQQASVNNEVFDVTDAIFNEGE
jgi:hypothetical protein